MYSLKKYQESIASNIIAVRELLSLKQEEVAEKAGVSRSTIIQMEKGEADPQLSTLLKVTQALNINLFLLFISKHELKALIKLVKDEENINILSNIELINDNIEKLQMEKKNLGEDKSKTYDYLNKLPIIGALIGSVIGTTLLPGMGTVAIGLLGKYLGQMKTEVKNSDKNILLNKKKKEAKNE